ncbi:DNA-3-methyladenine glycosylase I [Kocuria sp.]|uniref:DNA-3-methyladenine glycosylase I n=1 Tax=Kocuria sp. TaxID=1871328 RepID=UPI0026DFA3D9|nr:DNA-3-methyladenine glycosylase I [Kocuria sp.]MDO5618656.1 DNA-3-methyladenine glycosylase I [Kocuria sp.]
MDTQFHPAAPSEAMTTAGTVTPILDRSVLCADGLPRCPWALGNSVILADHDSRWGQRPVQSDRWFEALVLEIFQAGLAPGTALGRHGALQEALYDFHPQRCATLDDDDVDDLLLDRRLIRNRAKLVAVVTAARVTQAWDTEDWQDITDSATAGAHSDLEAARNLAGRLRELHVVHVGEGIARHFLARTGCITAHVPGCHRG